MTGRKDPLPRATGPRLLFLAALLLAAGATAVLVLSDSLRWMRLGVVAALWAALAGAFLAARYRRLSADRAEDAAQAQRVYELELEREIAARREFELTAEATARAEAEDRARDDIAALRAELKTLRDNLELLLGGEVLVERIALHAEATRMRRSEAIESPAEPLRRLTGDPKTDLIEKVREPWLEDTPSSRPIDPSWTPSWESGELRRPRPTRPTPTRPADQSTRRPADTPRPSRASDPAEAPRTPARSAQQASLAARLDGDAAPRPRRPEAAGDHPEPAGRPRRPEAQAGDPHRQPEAKRPRPEAQAGPEDTVARLRPTDADSTRKDVRPVGQPDAAQRPGENRPVEQPSQRGMRPVAQQRAGEGRPDPSTQHGVRPSAQRGPADAEQLPGEGRLDPSTQHGVRPVAQRGSADVERRGGEGRLDPSTQHGVRPVAQRGSADVERRAGEGRLDPSTQHGVRPSAQRGPADAERRESRPDPSTQHGVRPVAQRGSADVEGRAGEGRPDPSTQHGVRPVAQRGSADAEQRPGEGTQQNRPVDPSAQHGVRPVAADRSAPPRVISRRAPEPVGEAPLSAAAEAVRGRRAVDSEVSSPIEQARGKRAAESGVFPPAKPEAVPSYGDLSRGEPTRGKRAAASGVFPPVAQPEGEPTRGKRAAESGVFPPVRPGSAAAAARAGRRAAVDSGTFQPVAEPSAPQDSGGRRRKPEADAEPRGTHASGTSVAELLAAHGGATPRHRRRRDED